MSVTHKAKAGALLTGTEYEAADSHNVSIDHADLGSVTSDQHHAKLHAADHATGQADALSAADIGAATSGHNHDGTYDAAGTAASQIATHAGAADPHTGYRLESADHSHASTGLQGGKLAQANTHESPDTDSGTSSLHHTIGTGANQAAAGNHTHTTTYTFANGVTISSGTGTPEGSVTAPAGSLYLDTGGELYIKTSGSGNTGWRANVNV